MYISSFGSPKFASSCTNSILGQVVILVAMVGPTYTLTKAKFSLTNF